MASTIQNACRRLTHRDFLNHPESLSHCCPVVLAHGSRSFAVLVLETHDRTACLLGRLPLEKLEAMSRLSAALTMGGWACGKVRLEVPPAGLSCPLTRPLLLG